MNILELGKGNPEDRFGTLGILEFILESQHQYNTWLLKT